MKLIGWIQIKTKIGFFFFFFFSIPFLGLAPVKGSDAGLVNCISDNNINKDRVKFKSSLDGIACKNIKRF